MPCTHPSRRDPSFLRSPWHSSWRWRSALAALFGLAAVLGPLPSKANDRPFQNARTALEEDDAGTWSFEFWVQRRGSVRGLSFEPEYGFTTQTSVQMELTRLLDRHDQETGQEAEIEFKHVFNNLARDGWGAGVSLALSHEHTRWDGNTRTVAFKLPLSLALGDDSRLLHLNVGRLRSTGAAWETTVSAAYEFDLRPRWRGYAEAARQGEERFAQVGVRHWLRKEKLALDFSLQQSRFSGERANGFILGVGWYDL